MARNDSDWVVYMVECADGSLYTGISNRLQARLEAHNTGLGAKYTRGRLPVTLVYVEAAASKSCASKREVELKKISRAAKLEVVGAWQSAGVDSEKR